MVDKNIEREEYKNNFTVLYINGILDFDDILKKQGELEKRIQELKDNNKNFILDLRNVHESVSAAVGYLWQWYSDVCEYNGKMGLVVDKKSHIYKSLEQIGAVGLIPISHTIKQMLEQI